MPINLTGLASGLDTETIVSQLMALEQNKVTAVQRRQIGVQQHKDDLAAIKSKLDAFKAAAAALSDTATWKPTQTTTSSNPTKIDVSLLGGAGIGGHSIEVLKLASSAQRGFSFTSQHGMKHAAELLLFHRLVQHRGKQSRMLLLAFVTDRFERQHGHRAYRLGRDRGRTSSKIDRKPDQ